MSERVRQYLRNNVLGLIAIFIALSGSAVAANVAKNSVKSKAIKDGQVKTQDLAADAVTSEKVAADSLTGADINESSLQGFAGQQGPVGPQGPPGPSTGPAGGDLSGNYPNPEIATGAVTSADIFDGTVALGDLAPDSVNSSKVVADSLDGSDVADNSSLGGAEINEGGLDNSVLQSRVNGTCAANQAIRAVTQNGSVTCEGSIPGAPTGAAAGDLNGSYPNPTLRAAETLRYVGAAGEPAFANGWTNFGGGFASAAFYKDRSGIVHLRGLVKGGAFGAPNGVGRIFTVPSGYGPCGIFTSDLVFGTLSSNAIGRITIYDSGNNADVGAEVGSGWISLDGISWRADGC